MSGHSISAWPRQHQLHNQLKHHFTVTISSSQFVPHTHRASPVVRRGPGTSREGSPEPSSCYPPISRDSRPDEHRNQYRKSHLDWEQVYSMYVEVSFALSHFWCQACKAFQSFNVKEKIFQWSKSSSFRQNTACSISMINTLLQC